MLLSQTCFSFVSKRYIVPTRLTYNNILDNTINQAPQLCSVFAARVGLAVFNILKAFSAAASKLETIRQVKNHNAPSETKPLIVHKLSHHFSFGIEFEVFKEDVVVENRKQHLILFFLCLDYSTATWLNTTVGFTLQPFQLKLQFLKIVFVQTMPMERSNQFIDQYYIKGHVHFDSSLSKLQVMMEVPRGSLVKEAGSLVNEVKWSIFGSSFSVLDSGLGFEIGDPSQRTLVGKAVKPTQKSISTSGAVNLRKVNRVRIGVQARVTKLLMR
ncbi:BnaC06g42600D [Brassica napus]|uniref:BnaC06g42600D protein n=1 Tax=Brassica napus TaxID=3708 RepID=A0A078J4Z7_BRANA|nr:BnaC06g42600D [Brassica napus]